MSATRQRQVYQLHDLRRNGDDETGALCADLGDGGGDFGDRPDLIGEVRAHQVDVVGQLLPDARHVAHGGLAAEDARAAWDWLATQPGGASVALRRLVEEARRRRIRCAFVADTYLPRDLVAALLRGAGLPAELVLVEGILLFAFEQLWELLDFRVFRDCPEDVRFMRRVERDVVEAVSIKVGNGYVTADRYVDCIILPGFKRPIAISNKSVEAL